MQERMSTSLEKKTGIKVIFKLPSGEKKTFEVAIGEHDLINLDQVLSKIVDTKRLSKSKIKIKNPEVPPGNKESSLYNYASLRQGDTVTVDYVPQISAMEEITPDFKLEPLK